MEKNMEKTYRYQPTETGIRHSDMCPGDSVRETPCILYPDNRRELLFQGDSLLKIAKYPFRPLVLAKLSPRYELDMHCVSGMAGYGRFAAVKGGMVLWLDEFQHLESEYYNGEMRYTVQDDRIGEHPIQIVFAAGRGLCGFIIRIDTSGLSDDTEIYFLHGGMLGWHTHSPYRLAYDRNMCFGNALTIHGECALITLDENDGSRNPYHLQKMTIAESQMSSNRLWKLLDNWTQQISIRAEGGTLFAAPPDALGRLVPGHLRTTQQSRDELVCVRLPVGKTAYAAVGLGEALSGGSLADTFRQIRAANNAVAERLTVHTGITEFDGAITASAFHTDGVFGDNVFLHGNLSWRDGYLGWRTAYGPLAYGMTDACAKHFENHFTTTLITEGPDKGIFCSTTEDARQDAIAFYNMHQTFLHQARRYWEYTGDKAFAKRLLPIVEGCIERDLRRVKPGEELLFENCLNTWISDHHWTIMGQCTQASAYLYNIHLLASELSEDPEKKAYYLAQAETIKRDMNQILWQPRKGVFAYARDLRGNGLLHTEPELADIYHTTELGVADALQIYQMLDWAEANLKWECTDNGARICHSSNWHPNGGDTYSHSVDELSVGEEFNLSLAYQQIGLADPAYDIFKFIYSPLYGGRDPGVYDFNIEIYYLKGNPAIYRDVALNIPSPIYVNGTPRYNPLFGDSIGMFGREVYEGILGVRSMHQKNEVWLTPCIPAEMPHLEMQSAMLDYVYDRTDSGLRLQYGMKHTGCTLRVRLCLPVAEIQNVFINGSKTAYTTEPGFCCIHLLLALENASSGTIEVAFAKTDSIPVEERRTIAEGDTLALAYRDERITELLDPQGLLEEAQISESSLTARAAASAGSGVFFLKMRAGEAEYLRPVKLRIGEKKKPAVFRSFREEFAAPYTWKMVNMDPFFNHASPTEAAAGVISTAVRPPEDYNQVNFNYYAMHVNGGFNADNPLYGLDNARWRSLVDENGIAMTGEGIPFRSVREGNCMAAATLVSPAYADRIVVPVGETGRAVYLLITGITLPMQSHVENLRILVRYADGTEEEHPLFNPDGIGDMWFNKFERYHDTPANGFENIGSGRGALSSEGLDLTKQILTDLEAHILRFHLREGVPVVEIEMRVIANDVIFALMGITMLQ